MEDEEDIPKLIRTANEEFDRMTLEDTKEDDDNGNGGDNDIGVDDPTTQEDQEQLPRLIRIANYYYDAYIKDLPDDPQEDVLSLTRIADLYNCYDEGMDEDSLLSLLSGKNILQDAGERDKYELIISNLSAQRITAPPRDILGRPTRYKARFWTEPGNGIIHLTEVAVGANPSWNYSTRIIFKDLISRGFLYVEVVKYALEPSTSKLESILGRARIPFPEMADVPRKSKRWLVKSDTMECTPEGGGFSVVMEWKRIRADRAV